MDGFQMALHISTRLEKEARMGEWNSKRQTDVLRMVYARKRATDKNTLCCGDSNGNVNVLMGKGRNSPCHTEGWPPPGGSKAGGGDMSQGGFLAWSVCLKEGVFVYIVCVIQDKF